MARRRAFNAGGELISKTITSPVNGVSQQPNTLRQPTQCTTQDNMMSLAEGKCSRRPPTEHIKILTGDAIPAGGYKSHIRDRDENIQHLVLIEDGDIRVFRLRDGVEATVTGATTYLDIVGSSASEAFAITSVADYSFIVNKETVVTLSGTPEAARENGFMIFWQESGPTSTKDWTQTLGAVDEDSDPDHTNNLLADPANPRAMCTNLISDIYTGPGGDNYPLWKQGIKITPTVVYVEQDDPDTDGVLKILPPTYEYSDEVYSYIGPTTQNFSDLPVRGKADFLTEIVGNDGNEQSNYWVKYVEAEASWVETVGPGQDNTLENTTMPHVLIQTVVGSGSNPDTFTFGPQTWADRLKGDADTAPDPSFIGRKITDVFFHRNRLGFLSEENVILSESGEFFNFFPTTVTTLVDSDPIDAASTNNRVALLDFAVPFNEALYLFSGHGAVQNVLTGGESVLSGGTAQITEASAFSTSTKTIPQPSGKSLYFVVDRGVSSAVYDYTVDAGTADAWDTTAHVPTYIPANVVQMSLSHKSDIMTCLSSDEAANLYVNSFYFDQEGVKIQNSWSTWKFHSSNTIVGAEWVGEILWIATQRADGLHLEKLNVATLTDGSLNNRVHLDSRETLTGVYTVADNKTRWTCLSDVDPETYGTYRAVMSGTGFAAGILGSVTELEFESGKILWAYGDYSDGTASVGRTYTHLYEFSKALITAPNEKGNAIVPVTQGRLQLGRYKLLVQDSGGFDVHVLSDEVNPLEITDHEEDYVYSFPSKILGAGTVGIMNPRPVDEFQFDVGLEANYARIQITGDSHLPFVLVGAEWEGTYTVRASRV